ncbi:MAG: radical SAM protein [Deltaproteobacteria bacterium]|jgi:hypothetical protein|nr:radical SAM protein [Deltaproteobacteria bacterium]
MSETHGLTLVHHPPGGQAVLYQAENRYVKSLEGRHGQRFSDYRARWAAASLRRDPGPFPLSLDLAINSGCGLSCLMCPLPGNPRDSGYAPMPERLYLRLMDQAREFSLPALTLGLASEPLLNPDAPRFAALAHRAGIMDIRLGTNAQALTPPMAMALIDSGLTRLEISIDAARPETYRSIRRGGELAKVERAIAFFLSERDKRNQKFPLLRLSFLTLPQNDGELEPFLERWGPVADLVCVQKPIWFPGTGLARPARPPAGPARPPIEPDGTAFCAQPWQRLGLDRLGQAWPCCSWYGRDLLPENAADTPIADIWRSRALEGLREAHLAGRPPGPCQDCADSGAF